MYLEHWTTLKMVKMLNFTSYILNILCHVNEKNLDLETLTRGEKKKKTRENGIEPWREDCLLGKWNHFIPKTAGRKHWWIPTRSQTQTWTRESFLLEDCPCT